uniref:Vacuolar protein sorting-associated protein 45 n=1 Tax=Ascaris suum TaxID=6253 RepID=F1KXX8_ASCSU
MDIVMAARQYISEMIRLSGPGMKIMIMDKETTSAVSCVYAQSDVMQKEVYLFERIDSGAVREPIKHLKCVAFLRPTPENVQLLSEELRSPKYAQYYIYFCNIISKTDVKTLAEADEQETVREMHEFYLDGVPLCSHLLSLNIAHSYGPTFSIIPSVFRRSLQSIIATLLAVKKRPSIRYQASCRDAKRLADEVAKAIVREESLFESSKPDALLLIIDRSEDPITPLLNQWTYEAMVHELLGIKNHRVNMESVPDAGIVLLSPLQDAFYAKNMYANFGEIGQNIKELMTEFQRKSQTNQKLESIADMKNFVEQYPQFRKISGTVSKHVTVVGELSRIVSAHNLLEVSEVEQQVAGDGEHSQCLNAVRRLLQQERITDIDACRLVMLYALRFETHPNNDIHGLVQLLKRRGTSTRLIDAVKAVLDFAGSSRRQNDLFAGSAMAMTKRFIKGLKGVENIYTQHEPFICQLLDSVMKGRLSETAYPHVSAPQGARVDNIILFIIGGATYEESRAIHLANERRKTSANAPAMLLLSTCMLNARSFIDELISAHSCAP